MSYYRNHYSAVSGQSYDNQSSEGMWQNSRSSRSSRSQPRSSRSRSRSPHHRRSHNHSYHRESRSPRMFEERKGSRVYNDGASNSKGQPDLRTILRSRSKKFENNEVIQNVKRYECTLTLKNA